MNDAEIKSLLMKLRYYSVSREDCVSAAQLIEKMYTGERFYHTKRGTKYTVIGEARFNTTSKRQDLWKGPWDGDMLTLYRGDDGVFSVRDKNEFNDGRFVKI